MALGFGFNKTKVLGAAEKFVQQGKLQNAIAEYEKVIKEDPKDLTVLNAIGDLYARVGQNDKACEYFKKVGDQYAQNGFTVKSIAVYKKLTRLSTAADALIKLAELYTQQGLFNDARSHYMQVADQLLKSGDNHQAARVLQKILELDPENTTTQSKLADLYIKLGKTEEARAIYHSAAESLFARKAFDAADEALSRVLSLDPHNQKALLLRGMIASDSGDTASAIQYLEQVPDLDSRPDALRALLHAKLQTGVSDGVEALALKLFTVHQDIGGITALAEWHGAHHHVEEALKLYDQYADRFFAHGPASLVGTLYPLIARIRNNPPALERMLRLLQKAGDTSHLNEVMELLAHAKVQSGDFTVARDLYKELSEAEPENPLHVQNYKQMLAKLGEDSMSRPLTTEESGQALMVEELEHSAPTVHQEYTPSIEKAIEAALTDAELFISYNVPLKAIAPLEAVLPVAPRDLRLNQRLASLYLRAGRFADAVRICKALSVLYAEFGHQADSERYAEEAKKYSSRAAGQEAAAPAQVAIPPVIVPEPEPVAPIAQEPAAPTVQEFVLDVPEEFFEAAPVAQEEPPAPEATVREFIVEAVVEPAVEPAVEQPQEIEIDVSHEWESMLTVEPEPEVMPIPEAVSTPSATVAQASGPVVAPPEPVAPAPVPEPVVPAAEPVSTGPDPAAIEDKIQEIRFYISQSFWDMARAALHDLREMVPESDALAELQLAISSGEADAAAAATAVEAPPAAPAAEPVPVPVPPLTPVVLPVEVNPPDEDFILELEDEPPPAIPPPAIKVEKVEPPTPGIAAKAAAEPLPAPPPPLPPPPPLEPDEDILGDLVADLEQSLGDFVPGAASKPELELEPEPEPEPEPAHAISAATSQAPIAPLLAQPAGSAEMNGEMRDPESTSVLSDILSELQQDLGEDSVEAEDPETHYNLGIAFKEMGLLDEAIGELQKVCHAVEVGIIFSQPVQAYTWLAQCLVDKGVPEAAVRWYQKALQLPGLDHNSRCAIYYDLGSAFEASGDKKSALANFMEVYSSNIDFRDVASRIKVLKA